MSAATAATETDPTPSPVPASAVQLAVKSFDELLDDELAQQDRGVFDEMWSLYGGDAVLELQALAEGTHPQQRGLAAEKLEETRRDAAAALAQGPVDDDA